MTIDELQELARSGDTEAEKELFSKLSARFRMITGRYVWDKKDAEDVVQETLAAVLERYRVTEFSSGFAAWTYGVLQNVIYDHNARFRRQKERFVPALDSDADEKKFEPDPLFEARLLDCFHKLHRQNKIYARTINLSYQGYKVADICRRLSLTSSNFYSALSRARAQMAACMKKGIGNR